jgi:hypothetical protein
MKNRAEIDEIKIKKLQKVNEKKVGSLKRLTRSPYPYPTGQNGGGNTFKTYIKGNCKIYMKWINF